jgi:hypothetical protein
MHEHGSGGHIHTVAEESHAGRPHPEHVVLDIGDDIGALIIYTDATMLGTEVEISPTGQDGCRTHKDVLQREINGRPVYTAVFDKLREGNYTLWVDDAPHFRDVAITGGVVAELQWTDAPDAGHQRPRGR